MIFKSNSDKMKNYLFFSCFYFSISLVSFSQVDTVCGIIPQKNGLVYYSGIIEVSQANAGQLYSNTKIWLAETFVDAKRVTQADVENSALAIKGLLNINSLLQYRINMNIQFKDGKCRYEITNIYTVIDKPYLNIDRPVESDPPYTNCNEEYLIDFDKKIKGFINSLKDKLISVDYNW
jgi:hypothetical protein